MAYNILWSCEACIYTEVYYTPSNSLPSVLKKKQKKKHTFAIFVQSFFYPSLSLSPLHNVLLICPSDMLSLQ